MEVITYSEPIRNLFETYSKSIQDIYTLFLLLKKNKTTKTLGLAPARARACGGRGTVCFTTADRASVWQQPGLLRGLSGSGFRGRVRVRIRIRATGLVRIRIRATGLAWIRVVARPWWLLQLQSPLHSREEGVLLPADRGPQPPQTPQPRGRHRPRSLHALNALQPPRSGRDRE